VESVEAELLPLLFIFLILLRGFKLRGGVLPRALVVVQATLHGCLLCLRSVNHSLRVRFASRLAASSGKLPPWHTVRMRKTLWVDMNAMNISNCTYY
jgi:hypothetical protein